MNQAWHMTFPNTAASGNGDRSLKRSFHHPAFASQQWHNSIVDMSPGENGQYHNSYTSGPWHAPPLGGQYINGVAHPSPQRPPSYNGHLQKRPQSNAELPTEKNEKTLVDVGRRFAETTSLGGISYMNRSNRWWSTSFWIFVFVAGLACCTIHLYLLFENYYTYPYSVINEQKHDFLPFPSVTICNRNPIKRSAMTNASTEMRSYLMSLAPSPVTRSSNSAPNRRKRRATPSQSNNFAFSSAESTMYSEYKEFLELYGAMSLESRMLVGHTKESMIIDCTFNGYECYPERRSKKTPKLRVTGLCAGKSTVTGEFPAQRASNAEMLPFDEVIMNLSSLAGQETVAMTTCGVTTNNFTLLQSAEYGNCYTFNSATYVSSSYVSRQHGRTYGLRLELFAEIQEYPSGVTDSKGFSVSIHPFHTMPFPEVTGISVSPGFETSIGIRYTNVSKLGTPYNDCEDTDAYLAPFSQYYTEQTCQVTCHYAKIDEICGCYYAPFEIYYGGGTLKNSTKCASTSEYDCVEEVEDAFKAGKYVCTCHSGCTETKHSFQYSTVNWPERSMIDTYKSKACELSTLVCDEAEKEGDEEVVAENFGVLNVYFEDLSYHNVYEEGTYDQFALASDVGGTLGLWLGISILTGVEVFQFFIELLRHACRKR